MPTSGMRSALDSRGMSDDTLAPPLLQTLLDEIRLLRQDLETQTAINIVEGVNTVETLAALGHFLRTRRPPTAKEATELERAARARWEVQVRHILSVAKSEPGGLDESLDKMLATVKPASVRAKADRRKPAPKRKRR